MLNLYCSRKNLLVQTLPRGRLQASQQAFTLPDCMRRARPLQGGIPPISETREYVRRILNFYPHVRHTWGGGDIPTTASAADMSS